MEKYLGECSGEGLLFFSKTNRLISHEIKNILAIISETLGLMDELMALAREGRKLEPDRLKSLTESVLEEIDRANKIIRDMNTLAHQVDEFLEKADISQTVPLILDISRLDANVKNIDFRITTQASCEVKTSPFFLNLLIYRMIKQSVAPGAAGREIGVDFESHGAGGPARIVFSGITSETIDSFPSKTESRLAEIISARLSGHPSAGTLIVEIPRQPGEDNILHHLKTFS